jgi:predicted nucleotidyltransferase
MKDLNSILSTLSSIKHELEENFHVKSIGVFGSAVRDDFRPDSDIDLIVEFERPIGIAFIDLADFIEQKMKSKIDLVSRRGIKPQYLKAIEEEIVYV